ncbi:MAG: RNA 2',3'-cyclic phosphodiesterase [Clostridiales bacterium]|nr:RNA 2',3'-cyclic phosphodiesterase [Clostridiales bacterium]
MRLFIAICFNDPIKNKLCSTIEELKKHVKRGNFTRRDNLHLTLVFIGETTKDSEIKNAMDTVTEDKFQLLIGGLGKFHRDSGEIYWVSVEKNRALSTVYEQLYKALKIRGFSLESRPFRPHLTLGREVLPEPDFDEAAFSGTISEMEMEISHISLMKSERISGKLVYTEIYSKKLGSGE